MTTETKTTGKPYKVNPGVINVLAFKTHTNASMAVREMTANSYDQYQMKGLEHKEPLVEIEVSKAKGIFRHRDYATGAEDWEAFQEVGNRNIEDIGKVVGGQRHGFGANTETNVLGQFHLAKMSYPSASNAEIDKVCIRSNNGKEGRMAYMQKTRWGEEFKYPFEDKERALSQIGLQIEVLEPKTELLNAKELVAKLGNWFGILVSRKQLKIIVKDLDTNETFQVSKPEHLKTDNEMKIDPILRLKNGAYITCRIEPLSKATHDFNIDVYVKYVKICSIHVDYLAHGWINCNALTNEIDVTRDRLISSDLVDEVKAKLNAYLNREGYEEQQPDDTNRLVSAKRITELANISHRVYDRTYGDDDKVELSGKSERKYA